MLEQLFLMARLKNMCKICSDLIVHVWLYTDLVTITYNKRKNDIKIR